MYRLKVKVNTDSFIKHKHYPAGANTPLPTWHCLLVTMDSLLSRDKYVSNLIAWSPKEQS